MALIHGRRGRGASPRRKLRKTRRNTSWVTSSASWRWLNSRRHTPNTSAWNRSTRLRTASASPRRQRRTSPASSTDTAAYHLHRIKDKYPKRPLEVSFEKIGRAHV